MKSYNVLQWFRVLTLKLLLNSPEFCQDRCDFLKYMG